jgi:glycogen operon protein
VRDYWRCRGDLVGEVATRLTGSSDLYQRDGRRPYASINFITAHDGFTLRDLVSYDHKHNDANGENNRDGTDDNRSYNHGAEGETDDAGIRALRLKQMRNLMATLLLSQGVPMITAGDEIGRTQQGNNNAYCQDSEISWLDWDLSGEQRELLGFVRDLIAFRRKHPGFRRRRFFRGQNEASRLGKDIYWMNANGTELSQQEWDGHSAHCLAIVMPGDGIVESDARGRRILDDDFLLLLNPEDYTVAFTLPALPDIRHWKVEFDTDAGPASRGRVQEGASNYELAGRSLVLLSHQRPEA